MFNGDDLCVDLPAGHDAVGQYAVGRVADDDRVASRVFVRSQRHGRTDSARLYHNDQPPTSHRVLTTRQSHARKFSRVAYSKSSVLFCSLAVFDPRVATRLYPFISVILTDSSTGSPVHVLVLSIQAVRGLPRLRAPGTLRCIISFSRQLPCFLMV